MSNYPKIGETWMRKGLCYEDKEVKILEEVKSAGGGLLYFVSYYSDTLSRRSCETVRLRDLYKKPVEVVSYQLMRVGSGNPTVADSAPKVSLLSAPRHLDKCIYYITKTTTVDGIVKSVELVT